MAKLKAVDHKWYGWKKDSLDARDYQFDPYKIAALPPQSSLRSMCPPIWNQGALGSCTAFAIAGAIGTLENKMKVPYFDPSELFIYYNERLMEGSVNQDSGAMIRDGIKSVAKVGVCANKDWPYKISQFKVKPSPGAYKTALANTVDKYEKVAQDQQSLKSALSSGYPVVVGFSVYESFESASVAKTGKVPLPNIKKEQLLGGHAVTLIGYDDKLGVWNLRNSWGTSWGDKGYFTVPYGYLTNSNLSGDFWVIKVL